jgi:hypothetical protein
MVNLFVFSSHIFLSCHRYTEQGIGGPNSKNFRRPKNLVASPVLQWIYQYPSVFEFLCLTSHLWLSLEAVDQKNVSHWSHANSKMISQKKVSRFNCFSNFRRKHSASIKDFVGRSISQSVDLSVCWLVGPSLPILLTSKLLRHRRARAWFGLP